jgi:hypothetical protein
MPQQAKSTIKYNSTKLKLLKTNAAIWFNKTCRSKHLTPKYINIKINGQNWQTQRMKAAATKIRINQEIKFLHPKNFKIFRLVSYHIDGSSSERKNSHSLRMALFCQNM